VACEWKSFGNFKQLSDVKQLFMLRSGRAQGPHTHTLTHWHKSRQYLCISGQRTDVPVINFQIRCVSSVQPPVPEPWNSSRSAGLEKWTTGQLDNCSTCRWILGIATSTWLPFLRLPALQVVRLQKLKYKFTVFAYLPVRGNGHFLDPN